ncbi:Crp/Fnr family transcriptional regulator [Fluviicola sp.]|uniref:Crp/Fnr family transcriptional regulator n=1 Tax=Fluviicola sp. TaxID=1917219 RepID=UPI0031D456A7
MSHIFKQHLEKFISISDEEFETILTYFTPLQVSKKENLLQEGQVCRQHYFVLKGCLRKFFINEKGVEITTEFAIETWWLTDNKSFEFQSESPFSFQAVEKSEVLVIDFHSQEKLLQDFPVMERYFRFVYQRAYAAVQMRLKFLYNYSKDELYFHFIRLHPEFVQRIPQYLVASYLGFTPEYLSEIRKKKRS